MRAASVRARQGGAGGNRPGGLAGLQFWQKLWAVLGATLRNGQRMAPDVTLPRNGSYSLAAATFSVDVASPAATSARTRSRLIIMAAWAPAAAATTICCMGVVAS